MLILNNKNQSNQKQDRTVKAQEPVLEKKHKKRRKIRT